MMNPTPSPYATKIINNLHETQNTLELSIRKPSFEVGQEVEVYYKRTRRYHRCRVRSISFESWGHEAADNTFVIWAHWRYDCVALDKTIAVKFLVGYERESGEIGSSIREIAE